MHDFWNDAIDFVPMSLIMPDLTIAAIAIIIFVVIVWSSEEETKED